jgi:hypothetical protein
MGWEPIPVQHPKNLGYLEQLIHVQPYYMIMIGTGLAKTGSSETASFEVQRPSMSLC